MDDQYRGDASPSDPRAAVPALRYPGVWVSVGWLMVALVVWASLAPELPEHAVAVPDRLGHLLAYLLLAIWFAAVYPGRGKPFLAGGLILLGAGLEVLQGLGGVRHAELGDLVADTMGTVLGALLPRRISVPWIAWLDRLFFGPGR